MPPPDHYKFEAHSMTSIAHSGSCHLVGAGPGDPDLLTVKAVKAIAQATFLLVDDLVSPDIVALAAATARVVHVGKRGGCRSTPQQLIEKLMIRAVRRGEHVVRLKGGDPFLFGRGGEEVEHLQDAGITVEVINGITSGQAALTSLGVPLTRRQRAHGVLFVTAHNERGQAGPDWHGLAHSCEAHGLTLLIYMGASSSEKIEQGLLLGLPADTPVAIVQNATRVQQAQAVCQLKDLHRTMLAYQLGSPCIIAVGKVLQDCIAALKESWHGAPYLSGSSKKLLRHAA